MELSQKLKSKSADEVEAWFLGALEGDPLPFADMLGVLVRLSKQGEVEKACGCAEFLHDVLSERGARNQVLQLLQVRMQWADDSTAFAELMKRALLAVFKDRLGVAFVKNCGLEQKVANVECLRRMVTLHGLKPDALCHDRTWGFGIVRELDDFYEKVTIDFTAKPRHQMSLAYAAEALALIDEAHLEARRYRDPEGLSRMAGENPGELVKIAIHSYRPMSAPELQKLLEGNLIEAGTWKPFWERARRELKADPLVEMPVRRNDAIQLLAAAKDYSAGWLGAFKEERNMRRILELLGELMGECGKQGLSEAQEEAVQDRLAFIAKGAAGNDPGLQAQAVVEARKLGLEHGREELRQGAAALQQPRVFLEGSAAIPARLLEDLIVTVWETDPVQARVNFMAYLDQMNFSVAALVLTHLAGQGLKEECRAALLASAKTFRPSINLVFWMCKNLGGPEDWASVALFELLIVAVECLARPENGDRLRSQNQLRGLFEKSEWLALALAQLSHVQRVGLMNKISDSRAWDISGCRSMLARFIRLYPDLQAAVATGESAAGESAAQGRYTSWCSYRERQARLAHLVEVEIPENSREIGVARSYGDLRENFEYQAAKDHQRLLMRRQAEWEQDLKDVKGSDFSGFPTDRAGLATTLVVARDDVDERKYVILGEWDGDERLCIISCSSQVAQALLGHRAGDTVEIPGETGVQRAVLKEVRGLDDEVRRWIAGKT